MQNEALNSSVESNRKMLWVIAVVSVVVPALVVYLMYGNKATRIENLDVSLLPHINAVLNTVTSVCLVLGFIFIKQRFIQGHRLMMMIAFVLSTVFLISYVIYHNNAESTPYGGEGFIRIVYFSFLISHIILAMVVVPFVLLAIYWAITAQYERHRRIVKWTFPIWTYVAISGVIVYLMISPYYGT